MCYQSIIYQIDKKIEKKVLKTLYHSVNDNGNVFFITKNIKDSDGFIQKSIFDFVEDIINVGFHYVNIIVAPQKVEYPLYDNNLYILWFVKNQNNYYFDKDKIREKHIWKNVEWGKRKKNYNDKGKDPGNVWLPTEDDGKGKITKHIIFSINDIILRIFKATADNGKVLINHCNFKLDENILINFNLEIIQRNVSKHNVFRNSKTYKNINGVKLQPDQSKIFFDTSEKMHQLKDESIDIMITSPPYWDLKNYYKKGQIGQETYQEYLDRLKQVWKETYRVLKNSGSMWININTRTKNKKPILIPQDIIKQANELGFYLKDIIIWHKSSGIPTHKYNLVDRFEYFLWFTKSNDFIINTEYLGNIKDYKNNDLNKGLIWNINRKAGSVGKNYIHPAIYPIKLIDRIIELNSHINGVVLDPFLGSGTTLISALKNRRSCIGYEYNEEFIPLIKHRLEKENISINEIEFIYNETKEYEKDLNTTPNNVYKQWRAKC